VEHERSCDAVKDALAAAKKADENLKAGKKARGLVDCLFRGKFTGSSSSAQKIE
jgi:hypothetical protein